MKTRLLLALLALAASALLLVLLPWGRRGVTIGSKTFPESLLLGDLATQLVRSTGAGAEHERTRGLGATRVLWEALVKGDIDVYPDYTGTIGEEILAGRGVRGDEALRRALDEFGVRMSRPFGFNNTYALGMKEEEARRLGVTTVSDLRRFPDLRFGFSNEFLKRSDGWPNLRRHYALPQRNVRGMEHTLAYVALDRDEIDVMELYSTEAKIQAYAVRVLADDRNYFPVYQAVFLWRADLEERAPRVVEALRRLEGQLSQVDMMALNARVELERIPAERVAAEFLSGRLGVAADVAEKTLWARLLERTRQHLMLVVLSLGLAVVVAVPLGVLAARRPAAGQVLLAVVGLVQTIPSLALLVLLIPLFGLGVPSAVVALFLYSLLPIVRNTYAGLHDIPLSLRESARALGLPPLARLRLVELPLASRAILAGIKTSAVINVGTATLGGLIGAGGYGQPIFIGITLEDRGMVLEGAIPAALLALLVQGLFELAERTLAPRGLRLKPE